MYQVTAGKFALLVCLIAMAWMLFGYDRAPDDEQVAADFAQRCPGCSIIKIEVLEAEVAGYSFVITYKKPNLPDFYQQDIYYVKDGGWKLHNATSDETTVTAKN